jgi:hypothetical protein
VLRHLFADDDSPRPLDTLLVFLLGSFFIINGLGLWLRRDGVLGVVDDGDARTLFLIGWTLLPIVTLAFTRVISRRLTQEQAPIVIVYGGLLAAFVVNLLALLNDPIHFTPLFAVAYGTVAVGWMAIVIIPSRITGSIVTLLTVTAMAFYLTHIPLAITDQVGESHIEIQATRPTFPLEGNPITVTWTLSGIDTVFLNGEGTVGEGEISTAEPLTFTVGFPDDSEITYSVQPSPMTWTVWAWLIGVAVVGVGLGFVPLGWSQDVGTQHVVSLRLVVIPIMVGMMWLPFYRMGDLVPIPALIGGMVVGCGWWMTQDLRTRRALSRHTRFPYVVDLSAILIVMLFGINFAFPSERYHQNFFLAPVNDVLHGKTVFVDTNAQYGMITSYVLAALVRHTPLPLTPPGMSLLSGTLLVGVFTALYIMLRRILHHRWLAMVALLLMMLITVYRGEVTAYTHMGLGPMRYGTLYLLMLWVALRLTTDHPGRKRFYIVLEYVTTTYAILWSLETALGTVAVYMAVLTLEALLTARGWASGMRWWLRRIGVMIGLGAVAFAGFNGFTWLRSSMWPNWEMYISFYTIYTGVDRFMDMWSPWVFVPLLLYGTLAVILLRVVWLPRDRVLQDIVPFGVAWIGVVQFYYWVNLPLTTSIHAFVLPGIFGAAFVLDRLNTSAIPAAFRRTTNFLAVAAITTTVLAAMILPPTPLPKATLAHALVNTATGQPTPWRLGEVFDDSPSTHYILWSFGRYPWATEQDLALGDLLALLDRFAPDADRVPMILRPDTDVTALMATDKTNSFRFSHPMMDIAYDDHILANPPDLQAGDILFTQANRLGLTPAQIALLDQLEAQYDFEWLAVTPTEMAVVRLVERGDG